jgi:hypothetical protein
MKKISLEYPRDPAMVPMMWSWMRKSHMTLHSLGEKSLSPLLNNECPILRREHCALCYLLALSYISWASSQGACWPAYCKLTLCHLISLIWRSWFMGADALQGNGITAKLLFLIRDKTLTSPHDPLHKVRKSRLLMFVTVQLMGFGTTFAITQTMGTLLYTDQPQFC